MPVTRLDDHAALIVIDLQKGIVAMAAAQGSSEIVDRSAKLAHAFREQGLPVVLVNVAGAPAGRTDYVRPPFQFPPDWTELVPELEQQPGDLLVTKRCIGAFTGTELHQNLQRHGVTQIFVTGIATGSGVESTARVGFDLGYNVVFVEDAMADRDAAIHKNCLEKVFPRLGELDSTENVLMLLEK